MEQSDLDEPFAEIQACMARFERTGDVAEFDRAITLCRLTGGTREARGNLASLLLGRYEACRDPVDLDECRTILTDLARTGPVWPQQVGMLSRVALYTYELGGDQGELDRAVELARFGVSSAAELGIDVPELHTVLGMTLATRFTEAERINDLDEAWEAFRVAADAQTGRRRHRCLVSAVRLAKRRLTDETLAWQPTLADEAIAAAEEVVANVAVDDPHLAEMLHAAGVLRRLRYESIGDLADLRRSVELLRIVVTLSEDDPLQRSHRVSSLGSALYRLFEATGEETLLAESIDCHRRSLTVRPTGHPDRPGALSNLAATLRKRALSFNDLDALHEAIALLREALSLAGDEGSRGRALSTLGVALQDLVSRTGDATAADEAVECAREAASLIVGDGTQQLALGNALILRYRMRRDAADLAEALTVLQDLLDELPASFVRSLCLHALAQAWREEFDRTGDDGALDRAITAAGRAVRADPLTDSDRAHFRTFFAELLLLQYERIHAKGPLRAAVDTFAAAAEDPSDASFNRVAAARRWADAAMQLDDRSAALQAVKTAMSLLPEVASHRLARADRERGLAALAGVAADAAALAIEAGDPGLAVRWLEQGRGILLGQTLDSRNEVTELRRANPDLAARLAAVDDTLAALDLAVAGSDQRHATARRRQELLAEIRTLPGFEDFLLPPDLRRVQEWAGSGPVVLLNVSVHRCDALVLHDGAVRVIPLPALTLGEAVRQADRFAEALEASTTFGREQDGGRVITEVLEWLHDTVTGPVLDTIDCDGARVWWSPGGPLAEMPLHAAGRPGAGVLDRVISSYTPTVRALGYARAAAARPSRSTGVVAVAVPHAASAPTLPHADTEATTIATLWSGTVLQGADANSDGVLDALARCSCVHFACHGTHDPKEPSASRLFLRDRPLTVLEVSRAHLPDARLAVLSACHTARTSRELADEALHLAGAFQFAGYPGVVATLWHVNDTMAARIAVAFHTALAEITRTPSPEHAAQVLREVLLRFRDYPPSLWAGWVHSGV
ncbi:CHAT domain-containing protein [Saccharomonospora sp. NB11]|jgi:tetratricopeptide (TPR) repeat protein|uniref:CHAT domain-containing protein n=1 Tax=Saccharomonospora sp. NB11 TaxID=1642298 RepID=UPI0018D0812E|nr:CHAT domain-containing protein [Saccharomonospora sp. NB11]